MVRCAALFKQVFYVGGNFRSFQGASLRHLASFDGSTFSSLGHGVDGPVAVMAVFDGLLIAGGTFTVAGDGSATRRCGGLVSWSGR